MNCPKCNAVVSDSSKFCKQCGAKIEKIVEKVPESPESVTCIKCGASLKPGAKFCAKCGANQSAQTQAADHMTPPMRAPQTSAGQTANPAASQQPQMQQSPVQQVPIQPQMQQQPVQQVPIQQPQMQQPVQPVPVQQPQAQQPRPKKSKLPLVIVLLLVLLIALLVGGYFVLDQVFDVNPIAVITGGGEGKTPEDDADAEGAGKQDADDENAKKQDADSEGEKGDPALLEALDEQVEAVKSAYKDSSYEDAIRESRDVIDSYIVIAEENNLKEEAGEKIKEVFEIASKAAIDYCKGIEDQEYGSAGYEQVKGTVDTILELAASLEEKGYAVDSADITEYSSGIVQRFKEVYIRKINEITEREQWSRDEAWTYAEQAYSIQEGGKTVLFSESDLDDPLRLRYVYCLAWIARKRCENGVADGSMTKEDAFDAMTAILEETDYNLLVLQDIITYGDASGKDISGYQSAYNAIVQELKDEQNLSIVNSGVNSGTSVDVRKFWYFNDLDGDDSYKVDIHNGTTQTTRDWIRNNIPSYINR
ncbi:MAG: zinc ribbon domain-containing protein [Muribaculum sp.]|nr:zinc ribbon domain-containing protein [Muribaculum sp.]